jgi:hypothetical protein
MIIAKAKFGPKRAEQILAYWIAIKQQQQQQQQPGIIYISEKVIMK